MSEPHPYPSPAKIAHVVFRSSRFDDMTAWYRKVLGARIAFGNAHIAFLAYDDEHHRVAIVNLPDLVARAPNAHGFGHVAFTYAELPTLLDHYARLKAEGIAPVWCVHHGFTISFYYEDPDRNRVELQWDVFETAEGADAYLRSPAFAANPIGIDFDPDRLLTLYRAGRPLAELASADAAAVAGGAATPFPLWANERRVGDTRFIDPTVEGDVRRGLFNAIVAPRPIGWISTIDAGGRPNLAPFSFFNLVSSAPPIVMFACNTPDDRAEKDTLANVRDTGEFVCNFVTADLAAQMNATSEPLAAGEDEFAHVGIATAPSRKVRPVRVAASPCNLECRVDRIVRLDGELRGDTPTHVVFGRVIGLHIADDFLTDTGRFDTIEARPVARLGGSTYAELGRCFDLSRRFQRAKEALP